MPVWSGQDHASALKLLTPFGSQLAIVLQGNLEFAGAQEVAYSSPPPFFEDPMQLSRRLQQPGLETYFMSFLQPRFLTTSVQGALYSLTDAGSCKSASALLQPMQGPNRRSKHRH